MGAVFRVDLANVDEDGTVHIGERDLGYADSASHSLGFADLVEQLQGERPLVWLREPYNASYLDDDPDADPPTDDDCFSAERILETLGIIEDHAKQHSEQYPVYYTVTFTDSSTGRPIYPGGLEVDGRQFYLRVDWNRCEAVEAGATESPRLIQLAPGDYQYRVFPQAVEANVLIRQQGFLEHYGELIAGVRRVCAAARDKGALVLTSVHL